MSKKRKLTGMVIILVTLVLLGVWELWAKESLIYDKILVLNTKVEAHTLIEKSMVKIRRVEKAPEGAIRMGEEGNIIGKVSSHYIPKDAEIYSEYFTDYEFKVGGSSNKFVFSVPEDWIKSYPQTMKRGDTAYFYCGSEIVVEVVVAYVRDGTNQEVRYADKERLNSSAKVSLIEVIIDELQMKKLSNLADKGNTFAILYN